MKVDCGKNANAPASKPWKKLWRISFCPGPPGVPGAVEDPPEVKGRLGEVLLDEALPGVEKGRLGEVVRAD